VTGRSKARADERLALAMERRRRGDSTGALALLSEAVTAEPHRARLRRALGELLVAEGQFDRAVPHLRAALSLRPADAADYRLLARALTATASAAAAAHAAATAERIARFAADAEYHWRDREHLGRVYDRVSRALADQGMYSGHLFPNAGITRLSLPDPVGRIEALLAARILGSRAHRAFVETLFGAVAAIDPTVRLLAFELADFPGFRPLGRLAESDPLARFVAHRDMLARIAEIGGSGPHDEAEWRLLRFVTPWAWLRDILIPVVAFDAARVERPGFVQPLHIGMLASLAETVRPSFGGAALLYSAFGARPDGRFEARPRDHGGAMVPVSSEIAIVDRRMSGALKREWRRLGIDLIEIDVPTELGHADELFAVVPDPGTTCGRAVVYLEPRIGAADAITCDTARAIEDSTAHAVAELRLRPALAGLRAFALPVPIVGRRTPHANPVNCLVMPLHGRTAILAGTPGDRAVQAAVAARFQEISSATGLPAEVRFIDLSGIDPKTSGGLHCLTLEVRGPPPA
jgi:hypothetical protein